MKTFKIWLVFVLFFFGGYGVSAMAQDDMVFQYKGNFSSMEKDGWVCNNRAVIGTDRLTLEQKATRCRIRCRINNISGFRSAYGTFVRNFRKIKWGLEYDIECENY